MSVTRILPILALGFALLITCGLNAGQTKDRTPAGHTTDSIETIKAALASGAAVLIDVREKREWDAGHLKLAELVSLSEIKAIVNHKQDAAQKLAQLLPKGKTIYFHCKSGGRVLVAEKLVLKYNFDIQPLQQGYSALLKEGFEKAK